MPDLIHIVYVSFASEDFKEKDLDDLLVSIRKKNKEYEITGLLLYNNGSFIQVIEGKQNTIHNTFSAIKSDPRHNNVVLLHEEPINKRDFPDWFMGYKKLSNRKSSIIPGFSNYMNTENPEETIKNSTKEIMDLLESFKQYT